MALQSYARNFFLRQTGVQVVNFRGLRGPSRRLPQESEIVLEDDEATVAKDEHAFQNRREMPKISSEMRSRPLSKLLRDAATYSKDEQPLEQLFDPFMTGPYVKGTKIPQDVRNEGIDDQPPVARKTVAPGSKTIIQFPGDGCQYLGMCGHPNKFPAHVKVMYDIASDILGYDLVDLILNGPKEQLDMTRYSQPAILVSSLVALENLRDIDRGAVEECAVTCGFSIGEIAALVFGGAMTYEEGVLLAKYRGEAMQLAGDIEPGGQSLVFYGPDSQLRKAMEYAQEWCRSEYKIEHPVCSVAYDLFPHCKVIGGHIQALKFVEINYRDFRLKKVKRLPAAAAYHTEMMKPAADPVRAYLKSIDLKEPKFQVYSSATGQCYHHPKQILKTIASAVYSKVKWEQLLHAVYARKPDVEFPHTYECGPGRTLGPVFKLVNRKGYQKYDNVQPTHLPHLEEAEIQ